MRGLPLGRDACSLVWTVCAGILADGNGYCSGSRCDEPLSVGEILAEQQEVLKAEIVSQAKAHMMPPVQYRVIHRNANLTNTDVAALTQWAREGMLLRVSDSTVHALTEGDAMRGKDVFEKRCTGCHAMDRIARGRDCEASSEELRAQCRILIIRRRSRRRTSYGTTRRWISGSLIRMCWFQATTWSSMLRRRRSVAI